MVLYILAKYVMIMCVISLIEEYGNESVLGKSGKTTLID
jgi:hypothetical protein